MATKDFKWNQTKKVEVVSTGETKTVECDRDTLVKYGSRHDKVVLAALANVALELVELEEARAKQRVFLPDPDITEKI